ncbi:glutathione peroxidase [Qiania dongpingensis]|uniref:Glutathione peroxidase n=1 Tax=Qiania dongpingensis TaxID=2763669 RepID=A0A7G9G0X7_9FIRM|nr:glutathione peroxidase [Qiania dongpingensis]QNM04459.1 glutathione peroxidase [Qiania dongpingensis]
MNIYDFSVKTAGGKSVPLSRYEGQILLVVNTASKCGFTPQYEELERLYQSYKDQGLQILAFPCNQFHGQEPGSDDSIQSFCSLTYGVTFPVMAKIDVNGPNASGLYRYLTSHTDFKGFDHSHPLSGRLEEILEKEAPDYKKTGDIKWNFTKFLIGRDGEIRSRFEPTAPIHVIKEEIESLLKS